MNRSIALATFLAVGHLILVLCGVVGAHNYLPKGSVAAELLNCYGWIAGTNTSYGFFAPDVPDERRITLTITDKAGGTWTEPLRVADNREANQSIKVVLLYFLHVPGVRHPLLDWWAWKTFQRYPEAREVLVRAEVCHLPTMAEYRAGQRPLWETVYQVTFGRPAPPARGSAEILFGASRSEKPFPATAHSASRAKESP